MATAPPSSSARRWMLPVIAVVVVLAAVGGLAARTLYQPVAAPAASAPVVAPPVTSMTSEATTSPDWTNVRLTPDASAYVLSKQVQPLLQSYFDGINQQRYDLWRSAVTSSRAQLQPKQLWQHDYSSTRDGGITVYRIDLAPKNGLRVLLAFTSTQDLAQAPPTFQHTCIHWQVIWALGLEHNQWKLDTSPSGETPQQQACD